MLLKVDIEKPDEHWDKFIKRPPLSVIHEIGDYNVPKAAKMYPKKVGIKVNTEIEVKKLFRVMKMKSFCSLAYDPRVSETLLEAYSSSSVGWIWIR